MKQKEEMADLVIREQQILHGKALKLLSTVNGKQYVNTEDGLKIDDVIESEELSKQHGYELATNQAVDEIKCLIKEVYKDEISVMTNIHTILRKAIETDTICTFVENGDIVIGILECEGKLDNNQIVKFRKDNLLDYYKGELLGYFENASSIKDVEEQLNKALNGKYDSCHIELFTDADIRYGELVLFRIL